ncbi:MAG: hypothetical protein EA428_08840 [Spirochaetaceae bacterium]|nr:MAG: hypothetical protein EA428_08840 [Spirochaetaceae bacterium]
MSLGILRSAPWLAVLLIMVAPVYGVEETFSQPAPRLEVLSSASVENDELVIQGAVDLDLELNFHTGIETGILLRAYTADFLHGPVPNAPVDPDQQPLPGLHPIYLSGVYLGSRSLFGTPLELRYFIGDSDRFGTGREFPSRFGLRYFASDMRGMRYFRETSIPVYDGLHSVYGQGLRLTTGRLSETWELRGYTYADPRLKRENRYSSDLRLLFGSQGLSVDSFVGASYPYGDSGRYRAGTMLFFDNGSIAQFFAQIALPAWQPMDSISAEDLFLLFEPRLYLRPIWFALTFFWHPTVYEQRLTEAEGYSDIQLEAMIARLDRTGLAGGIRNGFRFRPRDPDAEQLSVRLSPFIKSRVPGYSWELALETQIYPYENLQSFTGVFSFATEL